jgi:hypothetical protein
MRVWPEWIDIIVQEAEDRASGMDYDCREVEIFKYFAPGLLELCNMRGVMQLRHG